MDLAGLVQPIGRNGESIYAVAIPSKAPIPAIQPIQGKQETFLPFLQNPYSGAEFQPPVIQKSVLDTYREIAREIQAKALQGKDVITPGRILDMYA